MLPVQPGDVLCVRTPSKFFGPLIRFGAWLRGKPATVDHVAIALHRDDTGIQWGIEAQPGGVRRVNLAVYDNKWLLSNIDQPKTDAQRAEICRLALSMLGVPYDWAAICGDAAMALGLSHLLLLRDYGDQQPRQVVCSSFAAWMYRHVGLGEPGGPTVSCTPGDWAQFITDRAWLTACRPARPVRGHARDSSAP